MEKMLVDAQLLEDCLYAFNEIPNRHLGNGNQTYDLAAKLGRVVRERKQNEDNEVLQQYVDSLAMTLIRNVNVPCRWKDVPCLSSQVMTVQSVVKALNLVDRFNYNMDMLGREDLVLLPANTEAA